MFRVRSIISSLLTAASNGRDECNNAKEFLYRISTLGELTTRYVSHHGHIIMMIIIKIVVILSIDASYFHGQFFVTLFLIAEK